MPRFIHASHSVSAILEWTRALAKEVLAALRLAGVPASRHACQEWLGRCNEVIEATWDRCGAETRQLFRTYDLTRMPPDNLPEADLPSYLHHAAVTLGQLATFLEVKVHSGGQEQGP